jgi:hypothetical protein
MLSAYVRGKPTNFVMVFVVIGHATIIDKTYSGNLKTLSKIQ